MVTMTDPILLTIMKIHLKRLGIFRVVIGVMGMYLTIPVFLLVHGVVVTIILQRIVLPLLHVNHVFTKNFIILDRYRVKGLSTIDTLNCLFCGWANGICTFVNHVIDKIGRKPQDFTPFSKIITFTLILLYTLPGLIVQTFVYLLNNHVIAASLHYRKISYRKELKKILATRDFASSYSKPARLYLIYQKMTWVALESALEQIESAWCPIKHFERMDSAIYPPHHKLFFEPDQIHELHAYLIRYGTVLSGRTDEK